MPPGKTIDWTPEMDALLGVESDIEIAVKYSISPLSVRNRRIKLGRHAARKLQPNDRALTLDDKTLALIKEIEPDIVAQLNARGVPLRSLSAQQIVEIAVQHLADSAKRSKTRALYVAK